MDPNANVGEQERLRARRAAGEALTLAERGRLAELVAALDGWLSRGGFAPAWGAVPLTAAHYRRIVAVRVAHGGATAADYRVMAAFWAGECLRMIDRATDRHAPEWARDNAAENAATFARRAVGLARRGGLL